MDASLAKPVTFDNDSDEYGSDISIDSIQFARILEATDTAINSAQTSFMQPETGVAASDYGSDLDSDEEKELSHLIARIEGSGGGSGLEVKESEVAEEDDDGFSRILRIPKFLSSQDSGHTSIYYSALESLSQVSRGASAVIGTTQTTAQISHYNLAQNAEGEIDDRPGHALVNSQAPEPDNVMIVETEKANAPVETISSATQQTLKAPISRFRASRPLSVSDLVSPTWCELQYSNNLDKHGRIPRTKAMKDGSNVHKTLELEVHEFVPVEVRTQEDSWGLRIWNVIQGLRTLRIMGMTRELDVWGVVDGEVVSGVIDELTYECPDTELEMTLQVHDEPTSSQKKEPAPDQMTIDEFFAKRRVQQDKIEEAGQQVYLIDTKTRAYPNLPSESSMRSTKIQLMMYRHLLSLQASGSVSGEDVFKRYRLNADKQFSPVFIDEISRLEFNLSSQTEAMSSQTATVSEFRTHSTLNSLWSLMATEFVITFAPLTLSPILTAVYRSQSSGGFIGQKSFVHNDRLLSSHVKDELQWWRGQRKPRGVEIEDAFKCKFCEFADNCSWRIAKEAEHLEKAKNKAGRPRATSRSKTPPASDVVVTG